MKPYYVRFRGRQRGAIGIFYLIEKVIAAESPEQARDLLSIDYEGEGGRWHILEAPTPAGADWVPAARDEVGRCQHCARPIRRDYLGSWVDLSNGAECGDTVHTPAGEVAL